MANLLNDTAVRIPNNTGGLHRIFLLLRIFCERYEGSDVGYVTDIYKGDLFVDYLRKKIDSFPQQQLAKALPTLFKIAASMLAADDFQALRARFFRRGARDRPAFCRGRCHPPQRNR
jgi:hypothetical protein